MPGAGLRTGWAPRGERGLAGAAIVWGHEALPGVSSLAAGQAGAGGPLAVHGGPEQLRLLAPFRPDSSGQPSPLVASKTVFQRSSDRSRPPQHQDFECQILRPDLP